MAQQCTAAFDAIARALGGFTCRHAPAVIHLRNPSTLTNWTLPVLELMMVTGAVLALIHAIRRLRREGDPTNLAIWFATVVYRSSSNPVVLSRRLRHPGPTRSRVRAQRLYRGISLRPAAAVHRRAVPGRRQSRLRDRAWSRGIPGSGHRRRAICVDPSTTASMKSSINWVHICAVGMERRQPDQSPDVGVGADDERVHLRHPRSHRRRRACAAAHRHRGITPGVADSAGGGVGARRYRRLEHPDVAVRRPSSAHRGCKPSSSRSSWP